MSVMDTTDMTEHQLLELLVLKLTSLEHRVGRIEGKLGLKHIPPVSAPIAAEVKAVKKEVKPIARSVASMPLTLTQAEKLEIERLLHENAFEFDPRRLLGTYAKRIQFFCEKRYRRPDGLLNFTQFQKVLEFMEHFKSLNTEIYEDRAGWRSRFDRFCNEVRRHVDNKYEIPSQDFGRFALAVASQFNVVLCGAATQPETRSPESMQTWDAFRRAYESSMVESISVCLAAVLDKCDDVVTDLMRVDVLTTEISTLRNVPLPVAHIIVEYSGFDKRMNQLLPIFEKAMPWVLQRLSEGTKLMTLRDTLVPQFNRVFCAQLICHKIVMILGNSIKNQVRSKRGIYFKRAVEWMDQILESEMERLSLKARIKSWGKKQKIELIDCAHSILEYDSTVVIVYDFLARIYGFFGDSCAAEEVIHTRLMPNTKINLLKKRLELMKIAVEKQETKRYNTLKEELLTERRTRLIQEEQIRMHKQQVEYTKQQMELFSDDDGPSKSRGRPVSNPGKIFPVPETKVEDTKPITYAESILDKPLKVKRSVLLRMLKRTMSFHKYRDGDSLAKYVKTEHGVSLHRKCEALMDVFNDNCASLIIDKVADDESDDDEKQEDEESKESSAVAAASSGISLLEAELRKIFVVEMDYTNYQALATNESDFGSQLESYELLSGFIKKIDPESLTADYVYKLIMVISISMKLCLTSGGRRRKNPRQMKAYFATLEHLLKTSAHRLDTTDKYSLMFEVFLGEMMDSLKDRKYIDMVVELLNLCCFRWKPGTVLTRMLVKILEFPNVTAINQSLDIWVALINDFTVSSFDSLLGVCLHELHTKMRSQSKLINHGSVVLSNILIQCGPGSKSVVRGPFGNSDRAVKKELESGLLFLQENADKDYVLRKRLSVYTRH